MDQWGALANATSVITRDDLSIRRKTGIVSNNLFIRLYYTMQSEDNKYTHQLKELIQRKPTRQTFI